MTFFMQQTARASRFEGNFTVASKYLTFIALIDT